MTCGVAGTMPIECSVSTPLVSLLRLIMTGFCMIRAACSNQNEVPCIPSGLHSFTVSAQVGVGKFGMLSIRPIANL